MASYRRKLVELARLGVEVTAVVPPEWREAGGVQRLEPMNDDAYRMIISPIRFNGHFHVHYYPELGPLLEGVRPDVVHLDEEPYNLATYLGVRSARRLHTPSLFFTWQNLVRRYPPPFRQMERSVYAHVAHALAGSEDAADILRAKGYSGPLSVVPQFGVDPDAFSPGPARSGPFTVGFLNRLIAVKEPLLTVAAFSRLPKDARLVIVGDGPLRSAVEEASDRAGVRNRVSISARVPSAEVPDLLRSLDALVLPSRSTASWKEQFGRVLIEAMAAGVPVVASSSGEIPRVVGDAGLIVPERDEDALLCALQRLYDDPSLRRDLSERGRRRVMERFTHATIAALTAEAYRAAVG